MARVAWICIVLAGCSASSVGSELVVDLKTDLIPEREFHTVRTSITSELDVDQAPINVDRSADPEQDYFAGVRIGEFQQLGIEEVTVQVSLLDEEGKVLAERPTRVALDRFNALTVVISRDCREVQCPLPNGDPSLIACLGGQCVDPRCHPEAIEYCDPQALECSTDSECISEQTCVAPQCVSNVCFFEADDTLCETLQMCIPESGCTEPSGALGETNVEIEGVTYVMAPGFTIEAVLPPGQTEVQLTDQGTALAFPQAGSSFADSGYVAADVTQGSPATIYRVDEAMQQLALIATPAAGNPRHITQLSFSPVGGDYGDFLFLCATSQSVAGDGIYRLAPGANTFSSWRLYDSCNGMAFDYEDQLAPAGTPALYASRESSRIERMPPLNTDPPLILQSLGINHGLLLYIPQELAFRGRMLFLAWNLQPNAQNFFIWETTGIDPWVSPTEFVADAPRPRDAAFSEGAPFGDVMLVAMLATGEILAYQSDGSSSVLAQGLDQPYALAWEERHTKLWVLERGRGRILRIRPL